MIDTILAVLGAFGGAAVIGAVVAKFVSDHASKQWLQTHKGQLDTLLETHKAGLAKETETHKLSLKRQELLVDREIAAADALMKLHRKIYPTYSHPDMEWGDACEDVARRLDTVEREAEDFLEQHSAVISDDVYRLLEIVKNEAADTKFHVQETQAGVDPQSAKSGGRILENLNKAREQIRKELRR